MNPCRPLLDCGSPRDPHQRAPKPHEFHPSKEIFVFLFSEIFITQSVLNIKIELHPHLSLLIKVTLFQSATLLQTHSALMVINIMHVSLLFCSFYATMTLRSSLVKQFQKEISCSVPSMTDRFLSTSVDITSTPSALIPRPRKWTLLGFEINLNQSYFPAAPHFLKNL